MSIPPALHFVLSLALRAFCTVLVIASLDAVIYCVREARAAARGEAEIAIVGLVVFAIALIVGLVGLLRHRQRDSDNYLGTLGMLGLFAGVHVPISSDARQTLQRWPALEHTVLGVVVLLGWVVMDATYGRHWATDVAAGVALFQITWAAAWHVFDRQHGTTP